MGNVNVGPNGGIRRDRRRELTLVFYFIFGFILIRVWILLIQTSNVIIESIGGIITFILFLTMYVRYRMFRAQQLLEDEQRMRNLAEVDPADLARLHSLFTTPLQGLSTETINSLHCFCYTASISSNTKVMDDNLFAPTVSQSPQSLGSPDNDIENHPEREQRVDGACCSICLAEYIENDNLMMLPCRHTYHTLCVREWLERHTQCPLCKQDVLGLLEAQLFVQHQLERLRNTNYPMEATAEDGAAPFDSDEDCNHEAVEVQLQREPHQEQTRTVDQVPHPRLPGSPLLSVVLDSSPPHMSSAVTSDIPNPNTSRNPLQPSPSAERGRNNSRVL